MPTYPALKAALDLCIEKGQAIPPDVLAGLRSIGMFKAAGDYPSIRQTYHNDVYFATFGYLSDAGARVTSYKAEMKRAMVDALPTAASTAWVDGGSELPLDEDADALVTSFQASELANVDQLFISLKQLKAGGELDADAESTRRADGYAAGLDALYNQIKVMAAGNQMLTFAGTDGSPRSICQSIGGTCVKLMGQRHRASWWKAHDLIPYRGNPNYDCGGWSCRHYLENDEGKRFVYLAD